MTPEERQHETAVSAFFKQAVNDGRMTERELREINGDGGRGHRKTLKVFEDFVIAACNAEQTLDELGGITELQKASTRIYIDMRLKELGLTRRHVELYINYPEWTTAELGRVFGMTRHSVDRALARIRRLPLANLRLDCSVAGGDSRDPALRNMHRIECSGTTDWLDENAIRQKF